MVDLRSASAAKVARACGLAALAVWALMSLDFARLAGLLAHADARLAAAAVSVLLAGQALSALRWRVASAATGAGGSAGWFLATYFRGCFYNAILPTGIGGDASRMLAIRGAGGSGRAVRAVVLDRAGGLALVGLAAAATLPLSSYAGVTGHALEAALGAGALTAGAGWLLHRRGHAAWLVLGLAYVAVWCAGLALLARSLGLDVGWADLPGVVLVSGVAMALPLSIGGLGTREAGFALALAPAGIPAVQAVALGLAFGIALTIVSLPGAPVLRPRAAPREAIA